MVDGVTRWLVVTRAGVLPMTFTSGLIAVLLAAMAPADISVDWLNVTLAVVGIVLAHLANNLMNDLADTRVGNDTENYPGPCTRRTRSWPGWLPRSSCWLASRSVRFSTSPS